MKSNWLKNLGNNAGVAWNLGPKFGLESGLGESSIS